MRRIRDPAHSGHMLSRLAFSKIPRDLSPHLVLNQSEALGVSDPELAMLSLAWTVLTMQACQEREWSGSRDSEGEEEETSGFSREGASGKKK